MLASRIEMGIQIRLVSQVAEVEEEDGIVVQESIMGEVCRVKMSRVETHPLHKEELRTQQVPMIDL